MKNNNCGPTKSSLTRWLLLLTCMLLVAQICSIAAVVFGVGCNNLRYAGSASLLLDLALFCSSILLVVVFALGHRISRARSILVDNAIRLANNAPLRSAPLPNDSEFVQVDEVLRQMAKALEQARRKERSLLDNCGEVMCSISEQLVFQAISQASFTVWERDAFLLVGHNVTDVITDSAQQKVLREAFATAHSCDSSVKADVHINLPGGGLLRWNRWHISWSQPEQAYFCTVADLTQQKELELRKQEFIAIVSHDLKTPLTTVSNFINMLDGGSYGALNEKGKNRRLLVKRTLDALVRMINDLLDVERLESEQLDLNRTAVPVESLAKRALELVQGFAESKQVKLQIEIGQEFSISCDPDRIIQVLVNLLANAIKFSAEQDSVKLSVKRTDTSALFAVIDKGPGVPEHMQNMIFERFKQNKDSLQSRQGTGLGLAIAKSLIALHGGAIGVNSKPGEGSTFWFSIPVAGSVFQVEETSISNVQR